MTPSEVAAVLGNDREEIGIGGRGPVVPIPMEMKPPPTRRGTGGPKLRQVATLGAPVPGTEPVPTPPVKQATTPRPRVRKVV